MSEINQQVGTSAPAAAPGTAGAERDGAADIYRRAVEAKPTDFAENPIGAMAHAMDRLGSAAGRLMHGKASAAHEGQDGLGASEQRLKAANEAVRANPNSISARHTQLRAALGLLKDMQHLSPHDPRRIKVAAFVVNLANGLGADGLAALKAQGLDVRGLLRLAAQITSRYGDAAGMQSAFGLEQLLKSTMPESPLAAMEVRDKLMQSMGVSRSAMSTMLNTWAVRLTQPGELPSLQMDSRTMVLNAEQHNASLGIMARAWWHDNALQNPADKDGFIAAFIKIANQSSFAVLNRKYRELRRMARHELASSRTMSTIGSGGSAPVVANAVGGKHDESGDMFAALAVFSQTPEGSHLPGDLAGPLGRFFAPS